MDEKSDEVPTLPNLGAPRLTMATHQEAKPMIKMLNKMLHRPPRRALKRTLPKRKKVKIV